MSDSITDDQVNHLMDLFKKADCILIGAGSGLSVDAGIDYMNQEAFARQFPAMVKRGFHMRAQLVGYADWSLALKWGYLLAHVNDVLFEHPPQPVYQQLFDLIVDRDYFVITSNVDRMFYKSGFDKHRIFTPQGDYSLLQCQTPCTNNVWPIVPSIDRALPNIDRETQQITDSQLIPKCPNCGGGVMMNVRGGDWFIDDPYANQMERYTGWLNQNQGRKLLIIEIGAGFNTPGVIRWPMERITHRLKNAHLVRINPVHSDIPNEIKDRSLSIQSRGIEVISSLWQIYINSKSTGR
jgi:NAD-dependent SIR2 family protein deacetylase